MSRSIKLPWQLREEGEDPKKKWPALGRLAKKTSAERAGGDASHLPRGLPWAPSLCKSSVPSWGPSASARSFLGQLLPGSPPARSPLPWTAAASLPTRPATSRHSTRMLGRSRIRWEQSSVGKVNSRARPSLPFCRSPPRSAPKPRRPGRQVKFVQCILVLVRTARRGPVTCRDRDFENSLVRHLCELTSMFGSHTCACGLHTCAHRVWRLHVRPRVGELSHGDGYIFAQRPPTSSMTCCIS